MDRSLRAPFNAAYSSQIYDRVRSEMVARHGGLPIPFRLAETPVFFSATLRERCERAAREIVALMGDRDTIRRCEEMIPTRFRVPGTTALPQMVAIDFAIARDSSGELAPRLIECQGFPSLYGMQAVMAQIWSETLSSMPGMPRAWSIYLGGCEAESYRALLRRTIVGECDPEEVVLVDIEPWNQKTRPDFIATGELLGVREICLTELVQRGTRLFAPRVGRAGPPGRPSGSAADSTLVPVRRIYNRVIFDELVAKGMAAPFDYRAALDVTWVPHPNWYWIWSKATLPYIDHPAVPRSHYVSDLASWPEDLTRYVLKPLYSFAGSGVVVDVDRARLDAVPAAERREWLLMEKVDYAPDLVVPDGAGVKVELRVLFLRPDAEDALVPAINLCRLSRGKMHGVDHNKNLDWVGSSVAIWPG